MADAKQVAEGLTKAQREALLGHRLPYEYRWEATHPIDPHSWKNVGLDLKRLGLITWHENPRETATSLTPLGSEVRAILEQENRDV